ncbi:unnamed protein product [Sphenostylis stenocarpa]|uniref:Uncharacterized protein n=1 Tax=Sphenostylis stenocarpa TaxID=92480 RepID=A0AA86SY53_9FABA|nr:unnamed protein product [Sphenostylis stenocarpa]
MSSLPPHSNLDTTRSHQVPITTQVVPMASNHVLSASTMSLEEILSKEDDFNWADVFNYAQRLIPETISHKECKHWTKEEHRLFLVGLHMYGRKWTKISEHLIPSKTPSQIASHGQKYFLHKTQNKEKKRKSIHDTTLQGIATVIVPHYINNIDTLVPPAPNFAVQPHKILVQQHMMHFNFLYNSNA